MSSDAQILIPPSPASMSLPPPPPIFEDTTIPDSNTERIFSYKYPADGSRFRNYVYAGGFFVVILILTTIIVTVPGSARGPAVQSSIEVTGTYRLNSYDNKFDEYLFSLDIPKFAITMIKASKEMITVAEPTMTNPNWTLTMHTEYSTHEVTFMMDQAFHVPWQKGGLIEHFCTKAALNIIQCTTFEPVKQWNLRTRMIFTESGLIDEKTNVNKNVATNKTYVRVKEDNSENIEEEEAGLAQGMGVTLPTDEDDWMTWE